MPGGQSPCLNQCMVTAPGAHSFLPTLHSTLAPTSNLRVTSSGGGGQCVGLPSYQSSKVDAGGMRSSRASLVSSTNWHGKANAVPTGPSAFPS